MPKLLVQITEDQAAWLDSRCNRFNTKARLIRDLIDTARYGLDTSCKLGKPSRSTAEPEGGDGFTSSSSTTQELKKDVSKETSKKKPTDPFARRALPDDAMPGELLDCQELLEEFWAVKKGTRSQGVWKRVCTKLAAWTPEDRRRALEAAISNGWGDVFEPRPIPAQKQEPPAKHPAGRVFTADRGFLEDF